MKVPKDYKLTTTWSSLRKAYWWCVECKEAFHGSQDDIIYLPETDHFYHEHPSALFRVIEAEKQRDGSFKTIQSLGLEESISHPLPPDLVQFRTLGSPSLKKGPTFSHKDGLEKLKSLIPINGITRQELAKKSGFSSSKVSSLIREILSTNSDFTEEKTGKKRVIKSKTLPDWWKHIKRTKT